MTGTGDAGQIQQLVKSLEHKEPAERARARTELVRLGPAAVPSLVAELKSTNREARWETAKALVDIPDVRAIPALVETLADRDHDVRWVAAEALISIGPMAIVPLLESLVVIDHPSLRYEGAHHVLKGVIDPKTETVLKPVITALESEQAEVGTPVAAQKALSQLRGL